MADLIFNDIIDLDNVSRETFWDFDDSEVVTGDSIGIMPYASYYPYTATLSEPYLSYMRAYVAALPITEHYVVYITQETQYISGSNRTATVYNFAHSNDLSYSGNFTGNVDIYKIYTNNTYFPQFQTVHDAAFTLIPGSALVYTDLTMQYPDIGATDKPGVWVFFILCFMLLLSLLKKLFRK